MQPTLIDLAKPLRDEPERWHSHRGESGLVWAMRAPSWDTVVVVHETAVDPKRRWRGYAIPYSALATGTRAASGPWGVLMDDERGIILDLGPCARSADACRRKLMEAVRKHMVSSADAGLMVLSVRSLAVPPRKIAKTA